jgi:galactose mutarotase-like enzyme
MTKRIDGRLARHDARPQRSAMDPIEIRSADLSAAISCDGAELQWLRDGDGRDLLWDGDPAFWTGRAPILFPIVGALAQDEYRVDGKTYRLPKHGFARHSRFAPVDHGDAAVIFRLTDSPPTHAVYPFPFVLEIRFEIEGATLSITATLSNPGDAPLPASFGFHPALVWPLPYGGARMDHVVRFDRPEPEPIRRIDAAGLLLPDAFPTPVQGEILSLRDDLFTADALIFDRPESRSLWYGAPGTPGIRVDFPNMSALGLWMKPGAGYLCIEPWQGHADPQGFAGNFRDKPGMIAVAPGQSRIFAMAITAGVDAPG